MDTQLAWTLRAAIGSRQAKAKVKGRPSGIGKNFDNVAVMDVVSPKEDVGLMASAAITLDVNGVLR